MKFAGVPSVRKFPAPAPVVMPVGPPGTVTTVLLTAPLAGTIVDVFERSLAGHHGEAALAASPHGFFKFGSARSAAIFVVSLDTMLRTTYRSLGAACAPLAAANAPKHAAAVQTLSPRMPSPPIG